MDIGQLCTDNYKLGEARFGAGEFVAVWDGLTRLAVHTYGLHSNPEDIKGYMSQSFWAGHTQFGDEASMHDHAARDCYRRLVEEEKGIVDIFDSIAANLIACLDVTNPRGSFVPLRQVVQKDYRRENPEIVVESYRAGDERAIKCSGDVDPMIEAIEARGETLEIWFKCGARKLSSDSFVVYGF